MVNKVILVGYCGKDPETKTFGDNSVTQFTLATSENYKDKSGERQSSTEWHSCQVWGKLSEIVSKYVKKGTLLYCEGKIKTETWDDKDGNKKYKTVIVFNSLQMLGGKPDNSGTEKPQSKHEEQEWTGPGNDPAQDLPF